MFISILPPVFIEVENRWNRDEVVKNLYHFENDDVNWLIYVFVPRYVNRSAV